MGLLAARGQEMGGVLGMGMGMEYDGSDAVGLPETRLRVLRARFDKRSPLLGGEDGFVREKRILEGGCKDLERVVGELRGVVRGLTLRDRKGEGEGEGRRRRRSF